MKFALVIFPQKSWQNLMDIYLSYSPRRDLYKSTFISSYRKMAQALNLLVLDSIPSDLKIHYAVDHEETQVLQLEQSYKMFKSVTNVPEEVDLQVGARVMFLDNSLIELGISNGSTGVVMETTETGNPKVAFLIINRIEVGVPSFHIIMLTISSYIRWWKLHSSLIFS